MQDKNEYFVSTNKFLDDLEIVAQNWATSPDRRESAWADL
jgi:hypothetical protein